MKINSFFNLLSKALKQINLFRFKLIKTPSPTLASETDTEKYIRTKTIGGIEALSCNRSTIRAIIPSRRSRLSSGVREKTRSFNEIRNRRKIKI